MVTDSHQPALRTAPALSSLRQWPREKLTWPGAILSRRFAGIRIINIVPGRRRKTEGYEGTAPVAPVAVDTVAWVHLENGRILCARPRGKDIFYVPGGKREGAETDLQVLLRETTEELTVALRPETVRHVGTYHAAQPVGQLERAVVRMSCYTGDYSGTLAASSEIDELAWFCYADRPRVPRVDQLLFDDLQAAGQLRA